jgi:hypothetical protein
MDKINKVIRGNSCVFFSFTITNFFLAIEGLLVLILGIFLAIKTEAVGIFEILFFILGFFEILLSYLGFKSRTSTVKLTLYVYCLGGIFFAQLITTILGITLKDKIIEWSANKTHSEKEK